MNDDGVGWLVMGLLTLITVVVFQHLIMTSKSNVTEGKVFKIYDATYQCEKINELKYE